MKKIYTLLLSMAAATSLFAQSAEDGLIFSMEEYEGTARTMAMGNAFTALGGDLGAVGINPASSGVFRYSQFTFTPTTTRNTASTDYLGETDNQKFNRFGLSNIGYVTSFDTGNYTGLLNYNFGIVYNRKNNYNFVMGATGLTDQSSYLGALASESEGINYQMIENDGYYSSAPWTTVLGYNTYLLDLDGDCDDAYIGATENIKQKPDGTRDLYTGGELYQSYYRKIKGNIEEYALNFGGNISDKLYFGANLNILSVNYSEEETYSEEAVDPSVFNTGFSSMDKQYSRETTGSGLNMKFGVIFTPVNGFRIGGTITTPTLYQLSDSWAYSMQSRFDARYCGSDDHSLYAETPLGYYDYEVVAPWRWSVGAAYVFGKKALVSVDYESVNYSSIKMRGYDGNPNEFAYENSIIGKTYGSAYVLRAGGELWIVKNIALRGGYDRYSSPGSYIADRQYSSFGLGWKVSRSMTLDFAWQKRIDDESDFQLYDNYSGIQAPVGTVTKNHRKFVLTLGWKF